VADGYLLEDGSGRLLLEDGSLLLTEVQAHTVTVTDDAGHTDFHGISGEFVQGEPADSAGTTDSITTDQSAGGTSHTHTQNDSAGTVDALALDRGLAVTDGAGQVDTLVSGRGLTVTDDAGMTDAPLSHTYAATVVDPAGSTDDVSTSLTAGNNFTVTVDDATGQTDTLAAYRAVAVTDPAGQVDALALDRGLAVTDDAGMTDAGRVLDQAKVITDSPGSTDDVTTDLTVGGTGHTNTVDDNAGQADTLVMNRGLVLTDDPGQVDDTIPALARVLTLDDSAGQTDTRALGVSPVLTDTAGSTDTASTAVAYARTLDDSAGSTDDITTSEGASLPAITQSGRLFLRSGSIWPGHGATIYGQLDTSTERGDAVTAALAAGLNFIRITNWLDEGSAAPDTDAFDATRWAWVDDMIDRCQQAGLYVELDLSTYRNMLKNGSGLNAYASGQATRWTTFTDWVMDRTNTVNGKTYKTDTTIWAVAIAGEPSGPNSGDAGKPASTAELTTFYTDRAAALKAKAPTKLVTSGGLLYLDWSSGIDWQAIFSLADINMATLHIYSDPDRNTTAPMVKAWLDSNPMPYFQEEFGRNQNAYASDALRAAALQVDYTIAADMGAAAQAFWNLGPQVGGDTFDVNTSTPAAFAVVQNNAGVRLTITDNSGMTDAPLSHTYAATIDNSAGCTDSVSTSLTEGGDSFTVTQTDSAGMTDAGVEQHPVEEITDSAGTTDSITPVHTPGAPTSHTVTVTDSHGAVDDIAAVSANTAEITDSAGTTDNRALTRVREITDSAGSTDTPGKFLHVTLTDLAGLSDSQHWSLLTLTDTAGSTDSLVIDHDAYVPPTYLFRTPLNGVDSVTRNTRGPQLGLMRHYAGVQKRGIAVLITNGQVVERRVPTTDEMLAADYVFMGGRENVVDQTAAAILVAAGYDLVEA
jgi:hypothetical protein